MMQLFDNPASPFCRKVRVLAHEAGQADAVQPVLAAGHALASEQMPVTQNPLGKIPVLVRDDGPAIHDSRVICRYLDDRFGAGMYPDSRIWEILTLEALADGIMESAVLMVYESRCRPEEKQFPDWVEAQWTKIDRTLDAIAGRWMGHLAGRVTIGQIAVACALGYLDLRHSVRNWREGREGLAKWYEGFSARPSMVDTRPDA